MVSGTDLALDNNPLSSTYRDVFPFGGDFPMVSGTDQILQNVLQTLGVYLGEWFLDNTLGLGYYQTVFIKNPNQAAINAMFISALLGVPGVQSILSFSSQINSTTASRSMSVKFRLQTISGTVTYQGTLPT
jgi:hypothetical protein